MNNDLHNIDDIFKSAQQQFEEEPSADVWDKINADLDKRDADKYKKGFISWRRIAVILIFLLSAFALYESGIFRSGPGGSKNNDAVSKRTENENKPLQSKEAKFGSNQQNKDDYTFFQEGGNTKTDKNGSGKDLVQLATNSDETVSNKNTNLKIETNREVSGTSSTKKNKLEPKQQTKISAQKTKFDKNVAKELRRENKNSKLKISVSGSDNNVISLIPNNQITSKGIIKKLSLEKKSLVLSSTLPELSKEKIDLKIPDSTLSESLVKQESKNKKEKFQPYWAITGFASNDWAKYKLDNDVEDNNGQPPRDEKQVIAKRERHEPSFSTGIIATRQFSKSLAIKTGLIYSNTAIAINPQELYATQKTDGSIAYKYNTSSGYGYIKPGFGLPPNIGDSLKSTEAQHNLQSLSIPLQFAYKAEKKKFSVTPSAGITANFITSAKVRTEVEDQLNRESVTINGLNGLKIFYLGFIADVNLQYNLDKRWALNILSTFKYAISPITKKNVVKTFPYNLGLGMGVTYKL